MFNRKIIILFVIVNFFISPAKADIIRDSEIEEVINLIISPLKKLAGINNLKIILVDDPYPNAFTDGAKTIYVSSSLISEFPNPDIFRGVIAHEIGHIMSKHVARQQEYEEMYNKAALITTTLGVAASIANGGAEGIAVSMGALHMRDKAVLAYSRENEMAADQFAMSLLEKSGHSNIGMINFFEEIRLQSTQMLANPYDSTHPLTKDRLKTLKDFNKTSKYGKSQNSKELEYRFRRISAKINAYTKPVDKILDCHYEDNLDELTHYMKAIKCFRIGNYDDAINHVNRLLMFNPKDPYYHELKGQIMLSYGKKAAIHEYDIAIEQRPDDVLLRLGRAIAGITFYKSEPYGLSVYYRDLQAVIDKESDNVLALFYMAMYYEIKGLKAKSNLCTAQMSLAIGNIANARIMAKAAMQELQKNSPDWYKASDILELAK